MKSGEGTLLKKGIPLPSPAPPLPPKTFTLIESPLAAFPSGEGRGNPPDVGKSRATKNREWPAFPVSAIAPAEERKGEVNRNMTSWAVFTFGWQVPADAKSGKNGSEMPPHTFSQEIQGEGLGREHPEGGPPQAHQLFAFHDLNLAGGGLFGFLAGNLDAQHAILMGRGDLVGFDVLGQGEHAAERAV